MISGLSIGSELKRFGRGRLPRVAIVVLVLMPLLYSALYLAAFWDPFGRTSQLPVALVNDDTGTQVDGEPLRAGDQVVDELLQNDQLDWRLVDAAEAGNGDRAAPKSGLFGLGEPAEVAAEGLVVIESRAHGVALYVRWLRGTLPGHRMVR